MNNYLEATNDLVDLHFSLNRTAISKEYRKMVRRKIESFLKNGVTHRALSDLIMKYPNDFKKVMLSIESKDMNNRDNILSKGAFYYHPALQVVPPPPVITVNPDGTFLKEQEEFFLKIKSCFTLKDALDYFYLRFPIIDRNERRDLGAIKYLYEKVIIPVINKTKKKEAENTEKQPIDLLLFTIDSAFFFCLNEDEELDKLLDLAHHVKNGLLIYQDKIEECILANINHTI